MGILQDAAEMVRVLIFPKGFSVCELGDQMMSGGKVPTPAKFFYKSLGCGQYVSVDGNGNGTIMADLNVPLDDLGTFDLVTDFGTGEHVFDQAQVWRTIHQLCKPRGYIVIDRPSQGYSAHCFYLITEGLIRDVAHANGYSVQRLALAKTPRGSLLRAVLRKPASDRPFLVPQQSRYQSVLKFSAGAA
jgi:SAM-dependent methyltransferase